MAISMERIERSILLIRGHKVMLDVDLAVLYGVTTKRLNEQVRRNRSRFPADFMFQLTSEEVKSLRSQVATSKQVAEVGDTRCMSLQNKALVCCLRFSTVNERFMSTSKS